MPRSICRCGWRRPTGAPRAMPGWSTRCCAAWRRTATAARRQRRPRDTPTWLLARWTKTYGRDTARAIAEAQRPRAGARSHRQGQRSPIWAEHLRGRVLPTGTVRTLAHGAISLLPGFAEGAWWVQDAAAALPARLLGDVRGKAVADLCAAPGGKTAQLALAGARVTAVDRSAGAARAAAAKIWRGFHSRPRSSPPTRWNGSASRRAVRRRAARCAVLLDRHHPPPPRRALAQGRGRLAALTSLAAAAARPRGRPAQARRHARLLRLLAGAGGGRAADRGSCLPAMPRVSPQADCRARTSLAAPSSSTAEGDLRTLPQQLADPDPRWGGLDGFYAARLVRN